MIIEDDCVYIDVEYYRELAKKMTDEQFGYLMTQVIKGEDVDKLIPQLLAERK